MDTRRSGRFTRRSALAVLLLAPLASMAAAPPEIAGEWQGKLAIDPSLSLTVRFTFSKGANGSYTAVLNSPDNPDVKNTPVNAVSWDGSSLKFTVPSLQGNYAGRLANGRIAGEWTQPGGKLPLELAPYQKAVLTADAVKPYLDSWTGAISLAGTSQTFVFTFKQGAGGALEGTFGIPDQGLNQPMSDVVLENGQLSFRALQGRLGFKGRIDNNRLVGKLQIPSPAVPPDGVDVAFKRGNYAPPPVALKLSAADLARLKGKWQGKGSIVSPQTNQPVEVQVALRFEAGSKGEAFGFVDSSAGGTSSTGVVVTDAALAGDKLTVRVAVAQAEFVGTLAGRKITGEWSQGAVRMPLELSHTP